MTILTHDLPTIPLGAPAEHPRWCDPRACRIVDHRPDGLDLLRVHSLVLWSSGHSRRLELIQSETLTDAGEVQRRHRPTVMAHGDPGGAGLRADDAAALGGAWSRGGELAGRESLPVTPGGVVELVEQLAAHLTSGAR